jgi:hypothetical protein
VLSGKLRELLFMSWLVLVGHLGSEFDREVGSVFVPTFCSVSDIGFSDSAHGAIIDRPPRPGTVPYDNWCRERLLVVRPDDTVRAVGHVEIHEGYVYDNRYRGDIDFTGIEVTISLRSDAYGTYIKHVGKVKVPELTDHTSWAGEIVVRIPSSRFAFPMPRGSSHPWSNEKVVGSLNPIKRFNVDRVEVQLLRDGKGRRVALEGDSCADRPNLEPALCIEGSSNSSARWWARLLP